MKNLQIVLSISRPDKVDNNKNKHLLKKLSVPVIK